MQYLPPYIRPGIGYFKDLISSSEEEECAPGGLYTGLVARRSVVVGLTLLALLLQFQVMHSTLTFSRGEPTVTDRPHCESFNNNDGCILLFSWPLVRRCIHWLIEALVDPPQ